MVRSNLVLAANLTLPWLLLAASALIVRSLYRMVRKRRHTPAQARRRKRPKRVAAARSVGTGGARYVSV